jgi:hypothetical protein
MSFGVYLRIGQIMRGPVIVPLKWPLRNFYNTPRSQYTFSL